MQKLLVIGLDGFIGSDFVVEDKADTKLKEMVNKIRTSIYSKSSKK